jgi:hypothetical protein
MTDVSRETLVPLDYPNVFLARDRFALVVLKPMGKRFEINLRVAQKLYGDYLKKCAPRPFAVIVETGEMVGPPHYPTFGEFLNDLASVL